MNEILKFKQRKMIPKAQRGLRFVEAGNTTMGNKVWADATTGDLYEFNSNPNDAKYVNRFRPGMKGHLGKSYNFYNLFSGRGTINGADYVRKTAAPKDYSFMKGGTRLRTALEEAKLKDPAVQKYLNRQQSSATLPSAPATVSPKKTPINWGNKFNDFVGGLSLEQQNWLKQNGLDSAKALQTYLDANNYYDAKDAKLNVDNKFGDNSKRAWNKFVASGIMGKNRDLEILAEKLKEVQPVIDAPDPFGYESKGNYTLDNARTLKTNGIRDWTTMLNYIKGNQESAFAQDMMHRFGSDLSKWKLEDVESAIGVSGHYGNKDRSRIQGFMAGNQATWNNQRQAAINDYAKKTFLTNPSGANTLGNQPGLSKEWAGADGTA